jgi:NTE family protein
LRSSSRGLAALLCAVLGVFVGGCAHYRVNPRLAAADPRAGYRFANLASPDNSDSLFVVLAFSGGGTRAAALSYGVLQELARTEIVWEGKRRSLLSEVDVISSVSGGSFTAAYYALFGDRIFQDYERRFLKQKIQNRLVLGLFNPWNWVRLPSPYFDRIDMAAEIYDKDVFDGRTFADLVRKGTRPFVILNATDMTAGARFEFTQDQFDPLCADLAGVPVARAVAASSAFPGLLSPLTLRSYAQTCAYRPPEWYANAREDRKVNPRRFAEAKTLSGYLDGKAKPFVHLLDGGISDNIGARSPIYALTSNDSPWSLVNAINQGKIRKVVVITVNARSSAKTDQDRKERAPGVVNALGAAANTPIDHYSFETIELLSQEVAQRRKDEQTLADCKSILADACPKVQFPGNPGPKVDYYTIDVSFDGFEDPAQRAYFLNLPTTFQLPPSDIDCLEGAGASLLARSSDLRALLADLDGEARAAGAALPVRPASPGLAAAPGRCGAR